MIRFIIGLCDNDPSGLARSASLAPASLLCRWSPNTSATLAPSFYETLPTVPGSTHWSCRKLAKFLGISKDFDVPRFTQPFMIEDFSTSANSLGVR
jgi:hypothetical protein